LRRAIGATQVGGHVLAWQMRRPRSRTEENMADNVTRRGFPNGTAIAIGAAFVPVGELL